MTSSEWPQDILNIPQATAAALDFRPENVLHGEAWISHPLQKLFSLDVPYNTGPVPQKIDTTEGKPENDFHLGDTTHTETTKKKNQQIQEFWLPLWLSFAAARFFAAVSFVAAADVSGPRCRGLAPIAQAASAESSTDPSQGPAEICGSVCNEGIWAHISSCPAGL